ncbi:MAG: hypothetical protein HYW07_02820 [Candidatus Latescibacteria bacterium]|nr:hypothetical protein [Candidatus Latescibacterota bacterium]
MANVKRIVCLANSRKLNGRCIAGKELSGGQPVGWIRPVSAREHEEVSEYERQYQDGSDPRVLDIMDVPLFGARPKNYQQENWLLDPDNYWVKVGRATWSDLPQLADPVGPLWINGHSTYNGLNDKIPLSLAGALKSSLRLIWADRVKLSVFRPGEAFGNPKRRVQGLFQYGGEKYWLWITDPRYERAYLAKPDGEYEIGESFLTISLGEPHNDACYKLIAAIIRRGGGTTA